MHIAEVFLLFIIYSFLGWVVETIYCSTIEGKFVYRGFLNGPICPIYGFGALGVYYLLEDFHYSNIIVLFFASVVVTSTLEYITSYLLEKLFDMKWWDYSNKRFHIKGRICLLNSVLFGILSVVFIRIISPRVEGMVANLSLLQIKVLSSLILPVLIIDTYLTVRSLIDLEPILIEYEQHLHEKWQDKIARYKQMEKLRIGFSNRRMFYSYPRLFSKKYPNAMNNIKEHLRELKEIKSNK